MSVARETEKLVQDMKVIIHDAEGLIRATGSDVSEKAQEARAKLKDAVADMRVQCSRIEEKLADTARETDKVIREHPYESIGVAAGIGFLIGILLTRR